MAPPSPSPPPLPPALAALHRDLGIPPDYAATRGLAFHPGADESTLIQIGLNDESRPIRLVPAAAAAWTAMQAAAAASSPSLTLIPVSGFRSVARQAELIRAKLARGDTIADILRYVAAPGFSEHHTGRALDIVSPEYTRLEEDFAHTAAFRWLEQHARRFGFVLSYPPGNTHGIGYEPWHWCWRESPAASP